MTARADASLIDGPARTVVLVLGGLACAAFALAWLLCRAAAVADRIEPGCDDEWWLTPPPPEPQVWGDASLDRLHRAVWQDEALYDEAVEALYADLDAWNRRAS